jgi:predicted nucleic acid-binding protein
VIVYLLSSQSLLDMLVDEPAMKAWKGTVQASSIKLSSVSIGQALYEIEQQQDANLRAELNDALEKTIRSLEIYDGVVPFDGNAAMTWSKLMRMKLLHKDGSNPIDVSSESRMVVATALDKGFTLVDASRPFHSSVQGLKVKSP